MSGRSKVARHQQERHRASHQVQQIAQAAARLIAEGQSDYHAAKLKALKLLRLPASARLPSDDEVDRALNAHFSLFDPGTWQLLNDRLRFIALECMELLEAFRPRIGGAIVSGLATPETPIELEISATEPKLFEHFLMRSGIRYRLTSGQPGSTSPAGTIAGFEFEFKGALARITVRAQSVAHPRAPKRLTLPEARQAFALQGQAGDQPRDAPSKRPASNAK